MEHERPGTTLEMHTRTAREVLYANMIELLASRGVDAHSILESGKKIQVRLAYFFDDDSCTATPQPLLDFVSSIYPERQVGVEEVLVQLSPTPHDRPISTIGIIVSNPIAWHVEQQHVGDWQGIVVPTRQVVLANYVLLSLSKTPMRYTLARFSLYDWLQSNENIAAQAETDDVSPEIVRAIAELLPDRPEGITLRRLGIGQTDDSDLQLPAPRKEILIF